MTSRRSSRSRYGCTASAAVSGFSAIPGRLPAALDGLDHRRRVVIGFDVEDDQVAPRIGEALNVGERIADHQVAVEGQVA